VGTKLKAFEIPLRFIFEEHTFLMTAAVVVYSVHF